MAMTMIMMKMKMTSCGADVLADGLGEEGTPLVRRTGRVHVDVLALGQETLRQPRRHHCQKTTRDTIRVELPTPTSLSDNNEVYHTC